MAAYSALADREATAILNAIDAKLGTAFPLQPSQRRLEKMADDGRLGKLQGDVDNLKVNFADLKHDMNAMSTHLSTQIEGVRDAVFARFDKFFELQNQTRPDLFKTLGAATAVGTVMLLILGFIGNLEKTILDTNIAFTNEKIATSSGVVEKNFAATNSSILAVADIVRHLTDTTIPRAELDNRIGRNERDIATKVEVSVMNERNKHTDGEITALTGDIQRLKDGQVSRAEHEQHWKQYDDRFNSLLNSIAELRRATSGASANDQITKLQDQVQTLTNKFIQIPQASGMVK